jgi:hypothetical protein
MQESASTPVHTDLTKLFERARRACEDAVRLSDDHRFIVTWYRMRPRGSVRPSSMLDGED